jgi:hypothetical protein
VVRARSGAGGRDPVSATASALRWSASVALEETVARWAVRGGGGVTVPRVLHDVLLQYGATDHGTSPRDDRALLVVPVEGPGRALGVLAVADRSGRSFADRDVAAAEGIAAQAAPALAAGTPAAPVLPLLVQALDVLAAESAAFYALADGDRRLSMIAAHDRSPR